MSVSSSKSNGQCNIKMVQKAVSNFEDNIFIHTQTINLLTDRMKAQAMNLVDVTFNNVIPTQKRCHMVNAAIRYFQCALDMVKFARQEYEAKYDETRLASEFAVNNV